MTRASCSSRCRRRRVRTWPWAGRRSKRFWKGMNQQRVLPVLGPAGLISAVCVCVCVFQQLWAWSTRLVKWREVVGHVGPWRAEEEEEEEERDRKWICDVTAGWRSGPRQRYRVLTERSSRRTTQSLFQEMSTFVQHRRLQWTIFRYISSCFLFEMCCFLQIVQIFSDFCSFILKK